MKRENAFAIAIATTFIATTAHAEESILKKPDEHPDAFAEIDVHGVVAYAGGPLALGRYGLLGFGPGVRANLRILKNGFIPSLNNSIAISFGADLVFDTDNDVRLVTPVAMQWNFWLTQHWSVFGEPGLAIEFPMSTPRGAEPIYVTPSLAVGGRYNFNDHITFTVRLGYPMSTIGASFFL